MIGGHCAGDKVAEGMTGYDSGAAAIVFDDHGDVAGEIMQRDAVQRSLAAAESARFRTQYAITSGGKALGNDKKIPGRRVPARASSPRGGHDRMAWTTILTPSRSTVKVDKCMAGIS